MEVVIAQQMGPAQQAAPLSHLLRAGGPVGWLILGLGIVLTLWGVVNLLRRPGPVVLILQAVCSLIPALLGAALAYGCYLEFAQFGAQAEPPKPVVFAEVISRGLLGGMIGPLASVVPAALGIAALARSSARSDSSEPRYENI